jgi:hypothetical protein
LQLEQEATQLCPQHVFVDPGRCGETNVEAKAFEHGRAAASRRVNRYYEGIRLAPLHQVACPFDDLSDVFIELRVSAPEDGNIEVSSAFEYVSRIDMPRMENQVYAHAQEITKEAEHMTGPIGCGSRHGRRPGGGRMHSSQSTQPLFPGAVLPGIFD